jgi:hypothetical protein
MDVLEQAPGAATTETLSTSTAEAVVRGAEGRRGSFAWSIISNYIYERGVAMEGDIAAHVVPTFVLATIISVWQEWENLDCLFWKFMINIGTVSGLLSEKSNHVVSYLMSFPQITLTGPALSWIMGGSRDTVARNTAGRASPSSPRPTLPSYRASYAFHRSCSRRCRLASWNPPPRLRC